MRYAGMPLGMWALFRRSFRDKLVSVLGYSVTDAAVVTASAARRYKEIIDGLPEFERADRFKMNIVNCALLSAFLLSMEEKPDLDSLSDYYE